MTTRKIRLVHYLNRFFAGVGGEEEASAGLDSKPGAIGPARGLQQQLGGRGEVVATLYCGDNRVAQSTSEVAAEVLGLVKQYTPDVFVAGPAFNAGRYGFASAEICHAVASQAGIPCITGFSPDNPGLLAYQRYKDENVYALPTSETAAGMNNALAAMARLALRLASGERIGPAAVEGYIPRGLRREVRVEQRGAQRAVDMLMAKLQGAPFTTEVSMESSDTVTPAAPLGDLSRATLALLSTSGVVPKGNPDKFKHWSNTFWKKYSVAGMARLNPEQWETVHGGYHTVSMFKNPHLGVPLDVLREAEDSSTFGRLHEDAYLFPGETMESKVAKRLGVEIAQDMHKIGIEGVVLVST